MAAERGLPCYILSAEADAVPCASGEIIKSLGASLVRVSPDRLFAELERLRKAHGNAYFIDEGGAGAVGISAAAELGREIASQERALGLVFDSVFVTVGSGTTLVGLALAAHRMGSAKRLIGISAARANPRAFALAERALKSVCPEAELSRYAGISDAFIGAGYGVPLPEAEAEAERLYEKSGIALDSVYTAKGYYGMLRELERRGIRGKNVLFIHTGAALMR